MKAKGRTGKGYYREYYGAPQWFIKNMADRGTGALLNVKGCMHYVGSGFDPKRKTWTGSFLTDFEMGLSFWQKSIAEADFIIHFGGPL
jgi:hypothetical protein